MLPILLSLVVTSAEAKSSGPYMWGGGPTLSTIAYPGQHPLALPEEAREDIDKVKGDLGIGAKGVLYMNKDLRANAQFLLGTGSDYRSKEIVLGADKILGGESGGYAFGGGGIGFGTMNFEGNESAELHLATYIVRGQIGGYYRLKRQAVEVDLFAEFIWPGVQTYVTAAGKGGDEDITGGNYLHGGLQATVYFGDFTPNKDKGGGGGKKKDKKGGKDKKGNGGKKKGR